MVIASEECAFFLLRGFLSKRARGAGSGFFSSRLGGSFLGGSLGFDVEQDHLWLARWVLGLRGWRFLYRLRCGFWRMWLGGAPPWGAQVVERVFRGRLGLRVQPPSAPPPMGRSTSCTIWAGGRRERGAEIRSHDEQATQGDHMNQHRQDERL